MARSNGSRSGSYLQLSPWRLALALALLVSQAKALYFYLNVCTIDLQVTYGPY